MDEDRAQEYSSRKFHASILGVMTPCAQSLLYSAMIKLAFEGY
jgi:hypothetical protein